MPNMHIWCPIYFGHKVVDNANCADNAFYAGALQCHLCRQCQLCAWDTVFLKLNFHPVNFHFMHIWHCLWHFLGLKYPFYALVYAAKGPFVLYKIHNIIFEHGFDPPPEAQKV